MSECNIVATDWEKVDEKDFYLSNKWLVDAMDFSKKEAQELRKRAKNKELFEAYEVDAVHYAIYRQMDAHKIIIDKEGDRVASCESVVIGDEHEDVWEADDW